MDSEFIDPTDWTRLLVGATSWIFLVEVALRAIVVYVALSFAVRIVGHRVAANLTLFELSVAVTLAATAGVVLESPDRGLLPALVVIFTNVALHRGISYWGVRRAAVERVITGRTVTILIDGVLVIRRLSRQSLSHDRLFSMLRARGIQQLGELSRIYSEPSGAYSVVHAQDAQPGLSVLPSFENALRDEAQCTDKRACERCGFTVARDKAHAACERCGHSGWAHAVRRLDH